MTRCKCKCASVCVCVCVCGCVCVCVCVCRSPEESPMDRALLYSIETMVIQWTQQMGSVLQRDSTHVLRQGGHPGPSAELKFWAAQRENLLGNQQQGYVSV